MLKNEIIDADDNTYIFNVFLSLTHVKKVSKVSMFFVFPNFEKEVVVHCHPKLLLPDVFVLTSGTGNESVEGGPGGDHPHIELKAFLSTGIFVNCLPHFTYYIDRMVLLQCILKLSFFFALVSCPFSQSFRLSL